MSSWFPENDEECSGIIRIGSIHVPAFDSLQDGCFGHFCGIRFMKTLFGPVPSRRLGRSLGIDVIPPKTCSLDCVYCESGRTTCLTLARREFVEPDAVLRDLDAYFSRYPDGTDVLTFSSAGEPTLYEPLGDLIRTVKKRFPSLPLIVLTNGSLLWDSGVRKDLAVADRVVPSLDAATDAVFQRINRPHSDLNLSLFLEGLQAFRRDYKGQFHMEVMIVSGFNDHQEELDGISRILRKLKPDRVELNTVVRPPADPGVKGLSPEAMKKASLFFPDKVTDIIGEFQGAVGDKSDASLTSRIVHLVVRRPCTPAEMAASLGTLQEEIDHSLRKLEEAGRIARYELNGKDYICLKSRR
jgi:wyosine [tRNA(Phe)-imidazoG37] synthetase (radical SAM superfamily)